MTLITWRSSPLMTSHPGTLVNFTYVLGIVASFKDLTELCTGVALNENFVFSGAKCGYDVLEKTYLEPSKIQLKWLQMSGDPVSPITLFQHPKTTEQGGWFSNSVIIMEVKDPLPSHVPSLGGPLNNCEFVGFGKSSSASAHNEMRSLQVIVNSDDKCKSRGNMDLLCVLFPGVDVPCQGDIGGPLICDGGLRGVYTNLQAKSMADCGKSEEALVLFDDIESDVHKSWIEEIAKVTINSKSYRYTSSISLIFIFLINIFSV